MTAHLSPTALKVAFWAPLAAGAAGVCAFDQVAKDQRDEISAPQRLVPLAAGGAAMLGAVPTAMAADYLMFQHLSTNFEVNGAEQVVEKWSPKRMGAVGEAVAAVVAGAGAGVLLGSIDNGTSMRSGG
jgi:hypothetical protein